MGLPIRKSEQTAAAHPTPVKVPLALTVTIAADTGKVELNRSEAANSDLIISPKEILV